MAIMMITHDLSVVAEFCDKSLSYVCRSNCRIWRHKRNTTQSETSLYPKIIINNSKT